MVALQEKAGWNLAKVLYRQTHANEWRCDGCQKTFDILDEVPTQDHDTTKLDVTVFGDPKPSYILQRIDLLFCGECSILR